jgi:hypothetical protein
LLGAAEGVDAGNVVVLGCGVAGRAAVIGVRGVNGVSGVNRVNGVNG